MALFKEILKEKDSKGVFRYSQGRFYLFVAFIAYYLTLGLFTFKSLNPKYEIDVDVAKNIIDALQYAIGVFGGYVFGSKFVEVAKLAMTKKGTEEKSTSEETNSPVI